MMKIILPVIVIALAVGGVVYFKSGSKNDSTLDAPPSVTSPAAPVTSPDSTAAAGAYVGYSDTVIASTAGTKILFFHAPWCPQCRALDQNIKSSVVPSGVTIIKTDYDTNQTLRQKYGVTIQTTLVKVDDQGNLVKKYVAYDSPTLESLKENLL